MISWSISYKCNFTLNEKFKESNLCNKEIDNPVVDHQHKKKVRGTGRIRNNICSNCNVFIAKTENNCTRFKIAQEELPEVLKNISEYFGAQQYNIIHYTDKESRPTLSKTLAYKVLKYWEYLYPGKKKRTNQRSDESSGSYPENPGKTNRS